MTTQSNPPRSGIDGAVGSRAVIFLTGVTGGLGCALLPRLLHGRPENDIYCLVRASDDQQALKRLNESLDFAEVGSKDRARVHVVRGDASAPSLGLEKSLYRSLAACTVEVFHLAADLRFDSTIEEARRANVSSTLGVLDFAAAVGAPLQRLNYVSTAYISGDRRDLVGEREINVGQAFFNAYEQSKMEAEELVRQAAGDRPITVYRPSMIIGEAGTGRIRGFFGFYEFLKLAELGKVSVVPADPDTRPDLVSMDYVSRAIEFLSHHPAAVGGCFHLTAGLSRSLTISQIVDLLGGGVSFEHMDKVPEIVRPEEFERRLPPRLLALFRSSALSLLLRSYMPYLSFERNFDVSATAKLIEEAGISFTPMEEVLPVVARYALNCGFGQPARQATRRLARTETLLRRTTERS